MGRRIYALCSIGGVLTMVVACGTSGTNGATATGVFLLNETVSVNFQATQTASIGNVVATGSAFIAKIKATGTAAIANVEATGTEYTQLSTRTARDRVATSTASRGSLGTAAASTATPGLAATRIMSTPRVTPTSIQALPTALAFRDPAGRFSFLIPAGWSVQQSPVAGVVVTVTSDTPHGSVNVATEIVTDTQTLDEYTAATVATIQQEHAGYQFAASGVQYATLGAYPARRLDLSDSNGEGSVHFVQYIALVGTTAYVLTISSADSDSVPFMKQAQVIVATFTFGTPP